MSRYPSYGGKGDAARNNTSQQWRDNYDSMTVSVDYAAANCADKDGYVWYEGDHGRAGYSLSDDGTCGFWGKTHFKTGIRNSRIRKQMTSGGHTIRLLDKQGEVVA